MICDICVCCVMNSHFRSHHNQALIAIRAVHLSSPNIYRYIHSLWCHMETPNVDTGRLDLSMDKSIYFVYLDVGHDRNIGISCTGR